MSTPSLQTFVTDASQVLNLSSISAVRSVVAVALANANAGTPLNPNLTTQQLWNEFYQVVTEPKSNIESFIANQMMKFFFSPPAPGGVGADKQVIFNDMGVLAGDTKFLWDKNANRLDVDGPVVITGDLTVATDAFKVISATKDVCIGTVTPTFNNKLTVVGGGGGDAFITSGNGTRTGYIGTDGTNVIMGGYSNHSVRIHANDFPQMQIAPLGVFDWYDGAASPSTRMTLNSTGLGIGVAPVTDCKLTVRGGSIFDRGVGGGSPQLLLSLAASSGGNYGQISNTGTRWALGFGGTLTTVGTEALVWDSSANVGIGVTPSAWGSGTSVIDMNNSGSAAAVSSSGTLSIVNNGFFNGTDWKYKNNAAALLYQLISGQHLWFTAGASTGTITDFATAKMVLDASGNLLVGLTVDSYTPAKGVSMFSGNSSRVAVGHANGTSSGDYYHSFAYNSTLIGSISQNGTTGVLFNTSSDYRLKESVKPISGGLARVNALKPSVYNWKSDGSTGEGFLAHELAEVVPFAVSGEKDAVNADGTIKSQGIDMSRIVPILVAAIQELTTRVQTLEAR